METFDEELLSWTEGHLNVTLQQIGTGDAARWDRVRREDVHEFNSYALLGHVRRQDRNRGRFQLSQEIVDQYLADFSLKIDSVLQGMAPANVFLFD